MPEDPIGGVIRNLLALQRLGTGISREVQPLIAELFDDLAAQIAKLDPTAPARQRYRRERLETLLGEVESMAGQSFKEIRSTLEQRLARVGVQQAEWAETQLQRSIGSVAVDIRSGRVGQNLMRSILRENPFEGETLKGWVDTQKEAVVRNVHRQLRIGMAENESIDDMVRRIRGRHTGRFRTVTLTDGTTRRQGIFSGGILQTTTRQTEAIVRTGVNFIANRGHLATYQENADILAGMEITATLDSRTSKICMALDGKIVAVEDPDAKMIPPFHYNCRTILTPIVDWEGLGVEPPDEGMRASQDGPVPASQKYEDWLKRQSPAVQNDVLGRYTADIFREGKMSLRDLIRSDHSVVSVAELRAKFPPSHVSDSFLQKLVAAREAQISGEQIEYATAWDPKTGKVVLDKTTGQKDEVTFTKAETKKLKDKIFTHNHPSSSSFSIEDVSFAIAHDLREMRATSELYLYTLRRPKRGWPELSDVTTLYYPTVQDLYSKYDPLIFSGQMSPLEAAREHSHELWSIVFKQLKLTSAYRRKKQP